MENKNSYTFHSDRLGFRKWLPADSKLFADLNADPAVMEYFPKPLSEDETSAFITRINDGFAKNRFGLWVVEEKKSGEFIGFIGLSRPPFQSFFTPCVEIGWRLAKKFWNQGYATEGAKECLQYAFNSLGLQEIVSFTAVTNKRSERIMQKIGMERIGEFDHPSIEPASPLCRHVLYRIRRNVK